MGERKRDIRKRFATGYPVRDLQSRGRNTELIFFTAG